MDRIFEEITKKDFADKIELLKNASLESIDLEEKKDLIIDLFNRIKNLEFESQKGKKKNVNSTASSKILHLCCPDLFVMWDSQIRTGYNKGESGQDYFKFLIEMKKILTDKELSNIIEELKKNYNTRATRIIDVYNWAKYNE